MNKHNSDKKELSVGHAPHRGKLIFSYCRSCGARCIPNIEMIGEFCLARKCQCARREYESDWFNDEKEEE